MLGLPDDPTDAFLFMTMLRRAPGVLEVAQDRRDGKFEVLYDPRRTHRDRLHQRIVAIGVEQGRTFEPLFDDR